MQDTVPKQKADSENLFVLHRTLGTLLFVPYEYMMIRVYKQLQKDGYPDVRPAHSAVLRHILPGGSRLVDLAEQAGMTKQSMAYLVQSLHRGGYLLIESDENDGRAKRLRLSAKGLRLQKSAMKISQSLENGLADQIGEASMRNLRKHLAQLSAVLTEGAQNSYRLPAERGRTTLAKRKQGFR